MEGYKSMVCLACAYNSAYLVVFCLFVNVLPH